MLKHVFIIHDHEQILYIEEIVAFYELYSIMFFLPFSECCVVVVDYIIDIDTVVQPRSGLRSRLTDTVKCVKKNICI